VKVTSDRGGETESVLKEDSELGEMVETSGGGGDTSES
jgi:hypothetical protein